ncbi:MAG: hypothetical protein U0163_13545 [Gemmatimonadaceae bacterium]
MDMLFVVGEEKERWRLPLIASLVVPVVNGEPTESRRLSEPGSRPLLMACGEGTKYPHGTPVIMPMLHQFPHPRGEWPKSPTLVIPRSTSEPFAMGREANIIPGAQEAELMFRLVGADERGR